MEVLSDGFGPDRISDLLAFILLPQLIEFTAEAMGLEDEQTIEFQSYDDLFANLKGDGHLFSDMDLRTALDLPREDTFKVFAKNGRPQLFVPEGIVDREKAAVYFHSDRFDNSFQSAFVLRNNLNTAVHTSLATNYLSYLKAVEQIDLELLEAARSFRIDVLVCTNFDHTSGASGLVLQELADRLKGDSEIRAFDGSMTLTLDGRRVMLTTHAKTGNVKLSVHTTVVAVQILSTSAEDIRRNVGSAVSEIVNGTFLIAGAVAQVVTFAPWPTDMRKGVHSVVSAQQFAFRREAHVIVPYGSDSNAIDVATQFASESYPRGLLDHTATLKEFHKLDRNSIQKPYVVGVHGGSPQLALSPVIEQLISTTPNQDPDHCAITTWNVKGKTGNFAVADKLKRALADPRATIVALQELCPMNTLLEVQKFENGGRWLSVPGSAGGNTILFNSEHVMLLDTQGPAAAFKGAGFKHECCVARLQIAHFRVLVVCVHLHQSDSNAKDELAKLKAVLAPFRGESIVLLGDFNLDPSEVQAMFKPNILFVFNDGEKTATATNSCHDNFGYSKNLKSLWLKKEVAFGMPLGEFASASDHAPATCVFLVDRSRKIQEDELLREYFQLDAKVPDQIEPSLFRCKLLTGFEGKLGSSDAHIAFHNSKLQVRVGNKSRLRYYRAQHEQKPDYIFDAAGSAAAWPTICVSGVVKLPDGKIVKLNNPDDAGALGALQAILNFHAS